jgi:hypothetical protein
MLEVENIYGIDYSHISWMRWIFVSIITLSLYLFIRFLHTTSERMSLLGGWKKRIHSIVYSIHVLSGPLGFLVIFITFIMIHPAVHGLLVLLIFILGFSLIKSYFLGKMLLLQRKCYKGQKIMFHDTEGFIKEIGSTSLTLQTADGARHLSYIQIFDEGFTQLQGNEIGGLQTIYIDTSDADSTNTQHIKDKLWESPYLDWSFDPEVKITNQSHQFEVKVLLTERDHLDDLINLISEWGYKCHLKN